MDQEKKQTFYEKFWEKHGNFYSNIWMVSLWIGYGYALINWALNILDMAFDRNLAGVIAYIALQFLLLGVAGIVNSIAVFIPFALVTTFPYLLWRGVSK